MALRSSFVQTINVVVPLLAMCIGFWQAAGGLEGLRLPRIRRPLVLSIVLIGIALGCAYSIDLIHDGRLSEQYHAAAFWSSVVLGLTGIGAFCWALVVAIRRRKAFDKLLETLRAEFAPGKPRRIAESAESGRALALLTALDTMLGPARVAPGHSWATRDWVNTQVEVVQRRALEQPR